MPAAVLPATAAASSPTLLRRVLALDAIVTAANAVAYLALSGPLDDLLGIDRGLLLVLGAFLLVYGAAVGVLATRRSPRPFAVQLVVEANAAWAVASIAVLVSGVLDLATAGAVWVPLQAAVVAGFAAVQYAGLRAVRRG